jgi:hypothetical protein
VFDWSHDKIDQRSAQELGHMLRRHSHTKRVIIRQAAYSVASMKVVNESLKPLHEFKWCTHLNWRLGEGIQVSPIAGMTSLQELELQFTSDISKLPLECFPHLTSLTVKGLSLANLAKIQNPLLLRYLNIERINDWYRGEAALSGSPFAELFRFKSLHTLRLITSGYMSQMRFSSLMSSLTQLQRLCIHSVDSLSEEGLPSTWFGPLHHRSMRFVTLVMIWHH